MGNCELSFAPFSPITMLVGDLTGYELKAYHLFAQERQRSVQSTGLACSRIPASSTADLGLDAAPLAVHPLHVPPRPAAGVQDPAQALWQRRQPLCSDPVVHSA